MPSGLHLYVGFKCVESSRVYGEQMPSHSVVRGWYTCAPVRVRQEVPQE